MLEFAFIKELCINWITYDKNKSALRALEASKKLTAFSCNDSADKVCNRAEMDVKYDTCNTNMRTPKMLKWGTRLHSFLFKFPSTLVLIGELVKKKLLHRANTLSNKDKENAAAK